MLEALGSARVLHHTVQRHELRYDDPAHRILLRIGCRSIYASAAARSRASTSIFFMLSIACMTRWDFSRSGSPSSLGSAVGMICHDRPNLSFSQPHGPSSPPAERLLQ